MKKMRKTKKMMTQPQTPHSVRIWLLLFVVSLASVVQAEDVTVTTYYPSPRGNYQTLNSTGQTNLATTGGNVGIGMGAASPTNRLDVANEARSGAHPSGLPLYVTGGIGASSGGIEFRHSNGTQGIGFGFNTIYATGTNVNQDLNLLPRGTGNVGIGTTTPAQRLDVNGTIRTTGLQVTGGSPVSGYVLTTTDASGNATWQPGGVGGGGGWTDDGATVRLTTIGDNVGIGTASPGAKLEINTGGGMGSAGALMINRPSGGEGIRIAHPETGQFSHFPWTDNTFLFRGKIQADKDTYLMGNVGIGTTSPSPTRKLHVSNGDILLDNGSVWGRTLLGGANDKWLVGYSGNDLYLGESNAVNSLIFRASAQSMTFNSAGRLDVPVNAYVAGSQVCTVANAVCGAGGPATVKSLEGIAMGGAGNVDLVGNGITITTGPGDTITLTAAGSGVGGSGNTNTIPLWTGSTILGNSAIQQNGTNVGIGTAGAGYLLDVADRMRVRSGGSGTGGIWFATAGGADLSFVGINTEGANDTMGFYNGDWRLLVDNNGQVTIPVDLYVAGQRVCRADGTGCPTTPATQAVESANFIGAAPFGDNTVSCPVGYIATGGGIRMINGPAFLDFRYSSYPDAANSRLWRCGLAGAGAAGVSWYCDVKCLRFPN